METVRPNVLIVEDDPYISLEMRFLVEECDCMAIGPAANLAAAMRLLEMDGLSGALLDINLGDELVWPVADALDARQVPFILISGMGASGVPQRFADRPFLAKPMHPSAVHRELAAIGLCKGYPPLPSGGSRHRPLADRKPPTVN